MKDKQDDKNKPRNVAFVVDRFVANVKSLGWSVPLTMLSVQTAHRFAHKTYDEFVQKHCKTKRLKANRVLLIPLELEDQYTKLHKEFQRTSIAYDVIARSFIVSLVSQYDAFLGRLIAALFRNKPELMKSCDAVLTFSQLSDFPSIDAAREYVLEKEIEGVLRDSHSKQFDWLQSRFAIKLRSGLAIWPTFIEVTERRNLFVHSDGVVSNQYLKVCAEHKVPLDASVKLGTELDVSPSYVGSAHHAIFEIGVKLAHVLWRKILPSELGEADGNLNKIAYDLLEDDDNGLAEVLLEFAVHTLKSFSNEEARLTFVINLAQAYKWNKKNTKLQQLINDEDWSATRDDFQLAAAVLDDDYDRAAKLMKKIGPKSRPTKDSYKEWPLFKEFRKSSEFAEAFKEVFGEALSQSPMQEKANGQVASSTEPKGPERHKRANARVNIN